MKKTLILVQILGFVTFIVGVVLFQWDQPQDERIQQLTPSTAAQVAAANPDEVALTERRINLAPPLSGLGATVFSLGLCLYLLMGIFGGIITTWWQVLKLKR